MSASPPVPPPGGVERADGWLRRNATLLDAITGALAFLLLGVPSLASPPAHGAGMVVEAVAAIGMPAAIGVRRRFPVPSAAAICALALAHFVASPGLLPVDLLIYVSVYSTTVHAPRWARRASLASALLGSVMVAVFLTAPTPGELLRQGSIVVVVFVAVAAPAVIAWALGLLRRGAIARWAANQERMAHLANERDQQARIAAAAERARIAREMHDVVAHSLSVIVAQADGGRYAARTSPELAAQALDTIATTARGALADTRRILGVLRGDAPSGTSPQPGVGDIPALVSTVRDSGLAVELVTWGEARSLPAAADLAVYRVVQESLTNVLKHAGPPGLVHARVDVAWHPGVLVVQIDDDGRGAAAASDGAGHGQLGMRERLALFGGTLEVGPRPGGGYRVKAVLPLGGAGTSGEAGYLGMGGSRDERGRVEATHQGRAG